MHAIRGFIFDNDDTAMYGPGLASPENHYEAAFAQVAKSCGQVFDPTTPLRQKVMGIDIREVGRLMIEELRLGIEYAEWKRRLDAALLEFAPYASVDPWFETFCDACVLITGVRIGIASSSTRAILEAKWRKYTRLRSKLRCFVAGDDPRVKRGKPEPDLLFAAADDLGLEPYECAYIGDSASDMWAASKAEMRGILITRAGRTFKQLPQNILRIESFEALLTANEL